MSCISKAFRTRNSRPAILLRESYREGARSRSARRNPLQASERRRKREDLLAATERALSRITAAVERKRTPLRGAADIGREVGAVIDRHKMAKHFDVRITDDALSWRRNDAGIAAEAASTASTSSVPACRRRR